MAMIEDMDRKSRGAEGMVLNVCLFDGNLHKEIKTWNQEKKMLSTYCSENNGSLAK